MLQIHVESAQHLRIPHGLCDLDPYVIIKVGTAIQRTVAVLRGGAHPVFNHESLCFTPGPNTQFKVIVMHQQQSGEDIILGTAKGALNKALSEGNDRLLLPVMVSKNEQHGIVCVSLRAQGEDLGQPPEAKEAVMLQRFLTLPRSASLHPLASDTPPEEAKACLLKCASYLNQLAPHAMAHGAFSLAAATTFAKAQTPHARLSVTVPEPDERGMIRDSPGLLQSTPSELPAGRKYYHLEESPSDVLTASFSPSMHLG